jgi:hypothetical protein
MVNEQYELRLKRYNELVKKKVMIMIFASEFDPSLELGLRLVLS